MKIANAEVAIPIKDNYNLYAGTSLMSLYLMGLNGNGIGILPLRVGYWYQLLKDELSIDPYIEYGYFPSNYFDLGAKLRLRFSDRFNIALAGGYIGGSTCLLYKFDVADDLTGVDFVGRRIVVE